jgi:fructoselysine-6-P-deglycase FrlB-like protein
MNPQTAADQAQYLTEIQSQQQLLPQHLARYLAQPPIPLHAGSVVMGLAEGSSYFALQLAQPWLSAWLGKPVMIHKPLNWLNEVMLHGDDETPDDTIASYLIVSQSGETSSLLHLLDQLPNHINRDRCHLITNSTHSQLAQRIPRVLPLHCPPERSIPATITMTASWLALLSIGLTALPTVQQDSERQKVCQAMTLDWLTPDVIQHLQALVRSVMQPQPMVLLGQYHTAPPLPEVALKLMETSGYLVVADRIENFSHGPKATLSRSPNVWVWVSTPEGVALCEHVKAQFPSLSVVMVGLGVASDRVPTLQLPTPVNELACQVMTLITGQLLSWAWCMQRQVSPNHPLLTKHV